MTKKKDSGRTRKTDDIEVSEHVPRYTESLDASLPAENIVAVQYETHSGRWVAVNESPNGNLYIGSGNTEPLARRVAALKAIRAIQENQASKIYVRETDRPKSRSQETAELVQTLDRLAEAIESSNEYALFDPVDQKEKLKYVKSAKDTLQTNSSVRAVFLTSIATILLYLATKFADSLIGRLADSAFELLQKAF